MHQSVPLIATIAASLGVAFVLGFVMTKLKLPALVGYLLAGVLLSPTVPEFNVEAHIGLAQELAEVGVMLLMFGVGLHFSLDDLWSVRKIALPGAILQICIATGLGTSLAMLWGWPVGQAVVFGIALSVASTVVLLKALEAFDSMNSINSKIAIGWLVVEDLAVVVILVLLPPLAGFLGGTPQATSLESVSAWHALGETFVRVAGFITLMLVIGRRILPWILLQTARTGSRELFVLCVISTAVCTAYASALLFGVSFALGAFFAGMMLRYSEFSHRAAAESLPLQDAFAVLFFVSVGMLFDPAILIEQPGHLIGILTIILFGKSLAAACLVLFFRYPLYTALTVSAGLAQIGEFSFILMSLGATLGLVTQEAQQLVIAGALLSISLNPLMFKAIKPALAWAQKHRKFSSLILQPDDPLAELPMTTDEKYLSGQVILAGYGTVGERMAQTLKEYHIPFVTIDHNREIIETLRASNTPAVYGDATEASVLIQAHIAKASMLVVTTPHIVDIQAIADVAEKLNPQIEIITRLDTDEAADILAAEQIGRVFNSKSELMTNMCQHILARYGRTGQEK